MSTNHHTAITTGAVANASTINSPLSEIDEQLSDVTDEIYDARNGQDTLEDEINRVDGRVSTIIAQSGTSDTEVTDSRDGYTVLNDRLDDINLVSDVLFVDAAFNADGDATRYSTIADAITACTGGETIIISPGIYSENVTIADDGVTIRGSGMPRYDTTSGRLLGGTIIRGRINCNNKKGVTVRDLGVDLYGVDSTDAISASSSGGAAMYQTFKNLFLLGNGYDAAAHALISQSGNYVTIDNVWMRDWFHGIAAQGSFISISNIHADQCSGDSIIISSKTASGHIYHVTVNNVQINGDVSGSYKFMGGPIVIGSSDASYSTRYIQISNVTAQHCNNGVLQIKRTGSAGTISDVSVTNCRSRNNQDVAVVGDFWIQSGNRIVLTNCASVGRGSGDGFVVDDSDNVGDVYLYGCVGDDSTGDDFSGTFYSDLGNGNFLSARGIGWTTSKAVPNNSATDIATVQMPAGTKMASYLVSAIMAEGARAATRTWVADIAYTEETVTGLTAGALYSVSTFTLAATSTTDGLTTFSITQTNAGTDTLTCYLTIQPLKTFDDAPVVFAAA
jgi:hypothetical protein